MSNITKTLELFGFTSNQTKVYLALLELGEARVQDTAQRAKILRTTAYEVLEQLKNIGIVSMFNSKGARMYMAEPPQKLNEILQQKQKAIQEILPELKSMYNIGGFKPQIRYYEGVEGLKTVYEDTLTVSNKRLYGILSMKDLFETVGEEYMEDYVKRRIDAGIYLQVIRSEEKEVKEIWPETPEEKRTLRYAQHTFVFPLTMFIYNNKVSLLSSKRENFGLIIESKEFMETQKALFDVLWSAGRSAER
jgi:sugar-specific transcriptional regulator TrmB